MTVISDHHGKGFMAAKTVEREISLILNNSYDNPDRTPCCRGKFGKVELKTFYALMPQALDFLGINCPTKCCKLGAFGE